MDFGKRRKGSWLAVALSIDKEEFLVLTGVVEGVGVFEDKENWEERWGE